ncbi:TPM domain-containing protein [Mycobacterium deserti]|uniref:TPM domain-containing protein n=1 Tax=Mycobacterium deserti TaxID=2978347 RepID=A0ABT2MEH9_9MYCO|nr:TPM domain-containing protein [Mycobacterium deserti]MCT7660356.1 TPM domain-containing protein [Mycobacterium deserti]
MRLARLQSLVLAVLASLLLLAPAAGAEPPFRVPDYVTDNARAFTSGQRAEVENAVERLYNDRRIRLWVVYVDSFGQDPVRWARTTMQISSFGDYDALLAVATEERAFAFQVPTTIADQSETTSLQRNEIEPHLRQSDWAGAAVAAAEGLNTASASTGTGVTWVGITVVLGIIAVLLLVQVLWTRRRRRNRREAEFAAARRIDPTDPNALASVPIEALDDLSKAIVVDVDNAVRTSDSELGLAVEEFGPTQTEPFSRALGNAKTTLAQAFNVRQILDDAAPESPQQRRDLLIRAIVAAAKADRELDAQTEAFDKLRDLVINAPSRLDALTQQMVDLTARLGPSEQALAALHNQFAAAALTSVEGNVETARQRLSFADQNITNARSLVARPAGQQMGLVDAIRAAESALGQARSLLDAVDSAGFDINRAVAALPSAIADIQNGINAATGQLQQPNTPKQTELAAARDAAVAAVAEAQKDGGNDPLGAFTQLTKADADLDQLLASVAEEREAANRLSRAFDQALFTAQARVKGVSDFIDTRRGSIGSEARTRLAEAVRQLQAAQDKKSTNLAEAIAHANGASMLAAQAQSLANDDVQAAQQLYTSGWGGGGGSSDMGAVIGGIIIGNVLSGGFSGRGGFGGGFGGFGGGFGGGMGMGRSTSFGGSSRSSSRSYSGGGGRF